MEVGISHAMKILKVKLMEKGILTYLLKLYVWLINFGIIFV